MCFLNLFFILSPTAVSITEELIVCSKDIVDCASYAKTADYKVYTLQEGSTFNSYFAKNSVGHWTRIIISNVDDNPNLEERLDIITYYYYDFSNLHFEIITVGGAPATLRLNVYDNIVADVYLVNTKLDFKANSDMYMMNIYIADGTSLICGNPSIKFIYYFLVYNKLFDMVSDRITIGNSTISIGEISYIVPSSISFAFIQVQIGEVRNSNEVPSILDVNIIDSSKGQKIDFYIKSNQSFSVRFFDMTIKTNNLARHTLSFYQNDECEVTFINETKSVNLRIFVILKNWYYDIIYSIYESPILSNRIEFHFQKCDKAPVYGSLVFIFNSSTELSNIIDFINQRLDDSHPGVNIYFYSSTTTSEQVIINSLPKNCELIGFSGDLSIQPKFIVNIDKSLIQKSIKAASFWYCSVDFVNENIFIIDFLSEISEAKVSGNFLIKTANTSCTNVEQFKGLEIETMYLVDEFYSGSFINLTYLKDGFQIDHDDMYWIYSSFEISFAELKVGKFMFEWTIEQSYEVFLKLGNSTQIKNLSPTNFSISPNPMDPNDECRIDFKIDSKSFRNNLLGKHIIFELNGPPNSYAFATETITENNIFFYDRAKNEIHSKFGAMSDFNVSDFSDLVTETIELSVNTEKEEDSKDKKKWISNSMIYLIAGCGGVILIIVVVGLTIFLVVRMKLKKRVEQESQKNSLEYIE